MDKSLWVFPMYDVVVAVPEFQRIGGVERELVVGEKPTTIESTPDRRIVMNFEIRYVDENGDEQMLDRIRPFFELWVGYLKEEFYHNLEYYDDTRPPDRQWVPIGHKKVKSAHKAPELGDMEGYGYAKISYWGDPNVGWG